MPRRWRQRLELSTNRRIFAAFVTVGFVTLLVKLAAAGKELVVAYQFGTSDDLDAFLIAYLVPSLATTVVAGSIVPAFIPTYVEVRERYGPEQANELLGTILFNAIIFFFLVCTVLAVSISHLLPILGSGFGDAKLATSMADRLLDHGIYVIGFSFPVVPKGQARIRTQMSAGLNRNQLDKAVTAFAEVGRELKVI